MNACWTSKCVNSKPHLRTSPGVARVHDARVVGGAQGEWGEHIGAVESFLLQVSRSHEAYLGLVTSQAWLLFQ